MASLFVHRTSNMLLPSSQFSGADSLSSPTTIKGHNFLTFLATAQYYKVDFVPLSWDFPLDSAASSGTAKIFEWTLDVNQSFVFKRTKIIGRNHEDTIYNAFVAELSILCHPTIRNHPHIEKLIGISWEISTKENAVWPVLVLEKAQLGDLHHFMTTEMAKTLSVMEKLSLCLDVATAVVTLHHCGGAHGDIKPQNVFIFTNAEGKKSAKMADFGYSYLPHEGDERFVIHLAKSQPWSAPEHHHRGFSIEQAQKQDVYSFGMLCFWVLFQAEISAKFPEFAREIPGSEFANQNNIHSFELLGHWKDEKRLRDVALELVTNCFGDREKDVLMQFFNCTLAHETNEREGNIWAVEDLLTQLDLEEMPYPSLPYGHRCPSLNSIYSRFCIKDLFFPVLGIDCRVRSYLVQRLKIQMESISAGHPCYENMAFQLAVCYYMGFGTARQIETAQNWIQKSGQPFASLEKQIEQIKCLEVPRILRREDLAQLTELRLLRQYIDPPQFESRESSDSVRHVLVREIHDLESVLGKEHLAIHQLRINLCSIYELYGLWEEAEIICVEAIEVLMNDSEPPQSSNAKAYQAYGGWEDWEEAEYGWGEKIDAVIKEDASKPPQRSNTKVTQNSLDIQMPQLAIKSPILDTVEIFDDKTSLRMQNELFKLISIYCGQRRWADAEWLSIHLMKALRSVLGEQHVVTNECISKIGHIYLKQGRSKEAERVLLYSLEINKTLLGDTHDQTLNTIQNLYELYHQRNDPSKKAEKYSMILMTILLKRSVYYRPEYHSQLKNFAAFEECFLEIGHDPRFLENPDMSVIPGIGYIVKEYYHQRCFKEAEALELQLIEICKKVLPHDHPQILDEKHTLCKILTRLRRFNEAESRMEEVFEKRSRVQGYFNETTFNAANDLAVIYMELGKVSKAETFLKETMSTLVMMLGEDHPDTLDFYANLAAAYRRCGRPEYAIDALEDTLERQRKVLGVENRHVFHASIELGRSYLEENRANDAERLYSSLITSLEDELGAANQDHPDLLESQFWLAEAIRLQNRLPEATQLLERRCAGTARFFGKTSREAVESLCKLGECYIEAEQWEEAEEAFREGVVEAEIVLEPDDELTWAAKRTIIWLENLQIIRDRAESHVQPQWRTRSL